MTNEEYAKRAVKSYIENHNKVIGEKMVYPIIGVKLDHSPKGEWDNVNNAVLISRDEKTGFVHLYIMTCMMNKEIIEDIFGIEIDYYVGHVVIDSSKKSKKYFEIVKKFSLDYIRQMEEAEAEKKMLVSRVGQHCLKTNGSPGISINPVQINYWTQRKY